jgi:orotate phosphoribosyltransferase
MNSDMLGDKNKGFVVESADYNFSGIPETYRKFHSHLKYLKWKGENKSMNTTDKIRLEMLEKEIILQGHFKLTSGLHSDLYVQKDRIWAHPNLRNIIIEELLTKLDDFVIRFHVHDVIITGPAQAGIPWAAIIADSIHRPFAYCEKDDFGMVFKRGFANSIKERPVIIVEDIITTGSSLRQTAEAIYDCKGWVCAAICIWDRSNGEAEIQNDFPFPIYSLINEKVQSWSPDKCPMCKENTPLDSPKK